jgi:hypothetical protein
MANYQSGSSTGFLRCLWRIGKVGLSAVVFEVVYKRECQEKYFSVDPLHVTRGPFAQLMLFLHRTSVPNGMIILQV